MVKHRRSNTRDRIARANHHEKYDNVHVSHVAHLIVLLSVLILLYTGHVCACYFQSDVVCLGINATLVIIRRKAVVVSIGIIVVTCLHACVLA